MKRIIKVLLVIIMCIPFAVKADMGAPSIKQYKATVIKPEGLDYYSREYNESTKNFEKVKKGHLNSGETFTVIYEDISSGRNDYSEAFIEGSKDGGWQNSFGIYGEDIKWVKPVEDEFIPNDFNIKEVGFHSKKSTVLTNAEVDLYKGPSIGYDSIAKIPKGIELSYEYSIGYDESPTSYIYVEYGGKKGWVNVLDNKIFFEFGKNVVTFADIKTDCGTIPAGTIFFAKYETDAWNRNITYDNNGCRALVDNFKNPDLASYSDGEYYYEVLKDIKLYEKPRNTGNVVYTIKKGSQITINYENYSEDEYGDYYFEFEGKKGFAHLKYDDNYFKRIDKKKVTTTTTTTTTTTEETTEETTNDSNSLESTNGNKKVMETKEIVIVSVIIGVVLAVTAVVVIILINKKKKNVDPVLTEQSVEQPIQPEIPTVPTEEQPVEQPVQPIEPEPVEQPTNNDGENN